MEYDILYSRLVTSNKLPDRFLNTRLISNPDLSRSGMGEIFVMIEIKTPWFPTTQIATTIIKTFSDAYWESGSTSDLSNFENALKKVNLALAQVTQNGETDWLGNLNALIGVIIDNKMHLAQAGSAEAYVFRDGKINNLTEGLAKNISEPHPLNTFSNITSGELKSRDKLLIANPELYKNLGLENIRQIINMSDPHEGVVQIAKLLKKRKAHNANAMIINLLSADELAKIPVSDESETVYLDKPLDSISARFVRIWQSLVYPIFRLLGERANKAGSSSLSFTKNYLKTLSQKREKAEPLKKRDLYEKEFLDGASEDTLLKDEEITYSPELDIHYYNEAQKEKNNKTGKFFQDFAISIFSGIKTLLKFLRRAITNKKTRPIAYISMAIILLLIVALFINHKRAVSGSNLNLSQAQNQLNQAQNDENKAQQALLSNDKDQATILFTNAINEAIKIKDYPVVSGDAQKVINDSYAQLDKLTLTTRFNNLDPIVTLSSKPSGVMVVSGQAYFLIENNLYKALASGGSSSKVATISSDAGNFQFGTILGSSIYLYTSAGKVYEFDTNTQKITPAAINGNWETANAISSYTGSIYLLDGVIGQIYKHTSSSSNFSGGSPYVTNSAIDLKSSNSLALDGAIYVLKNNGTVMKFQQGKLINFSLASVPAPNSKIAGPLKIYTDSNTSSIYIMDTSINRILEFDKSGSFIHQYVFPNIDTLTDFSVNSKDKKMWLLADSKLFEIGL